MLALTFVLANAIVLSSHTVPKTSAMAIVAAGRVKVAPRLQAPTLDPLLLNESANWPPMQSALDGLPVFAVANADGQPLQF